MGILLICYGKENEKVHLNEIWNEFLTSLV